MGPQPHSPFHRASQDSKRPRCSSRVRLSGLQLVGPRSQNAGQGARGIGEVRDVKQVEEISTELDVLALPDGRALRLDKSSSRGNWTR